MLDNGKSRMSVQFGAISSERERNFGRLEKDNSEILSIWHIPTAVNKTPNRCPERDLYVRSEFIPSGAKSNLWTPNFSKVNIDV